MKAVTQNLKTGKLQVDELPAPILRPDGLLVRVRRSLISLGTERAVIALANKGPLGKAKDRPDLFRKVLNKARQEGYWSTYKVVRNLMSTPIPLGYSCAGEVLEVGAGATEFHVGDRVACAGLGHANHAEIDYVPRNLAARMPESVSYDEGCFVTVGTIALHGVRLANIALGDRVVVLGLGLVGQIAAQLARCAGATVIACDVDHPKLDMARGLGAHHVVPAGALASTVAELTGGLGADSVLLCAAAKSDEPMRQAAAVSRLKGRVIVVGDVGMAIERRPFFEKELTLLVSRSYGPGRYDPDYELRVPNGTAQTFRDRLSAAAGEELASLKWHTVRRGETITSIARKVRGGVTASEIAEANSLSVRSKLRAGQELLIPRPPTALMATRTERPAPAVVASRPVSGTATVPDAVRSSASTTTAE